MWVIPFSHNLLFKMDLTKRYTRNYCFNLEEVYVLFQEVKINMQREIEEIEARNPAFKDIYEEFKKIVDKEMPRRE